MAFYPFNKKVQPVGWRKHDSEPVNVSNLKPYRSKAQREEARVTATKRGDGAWRSNAQRTVRPDHMKSA